MQDFDAIRPYRDEEVPSVVQRLTREPGFIRGAAILALPRLWHRWPHLAEALVRVPFRLRARRIRSVRDVQDLVSRYVERMIAQTMTEFIVTGREALLPDENYLFVSNHRDIVLDSCLLSYALHQGGLKTPRSAVGDNLFSHPVAAELMRLNKSFVVERNASGAKAAYAALLRTSAYIRHSMETGHSVWLAQREGRSKDGYDRTDGALVKMLALAYRKEGLPLGTVIERLRVVPMAISYELDPCDSFKARELLETERAGHYEKRPGDDQRSIIAGIRGFKGRVQLAFGEPLAGAELADDADAVTAALDRAIVGNLRVFPTHREAARRLGEAEGCTQSPGSASAMDPASRSALDALDDHLRRVTTDEQPYVLHQYANVLANRGALGL